MKGIVTWYNIVEGCGSFKTENGEDFRFYRKVLPVGTFLIEGDHVEYDIEHSDMGPKVTTVKKLL